MRPAFGEMLAAAAQGEVTPAMALTLITAREGEELDSLAALASGLRKQHKGELATFSRKVFIPLTTLCRDHCGYCTFRRDPGEQGAHTLNPDEVLAIAEAGARLGCKEALFSLGDRPEAAFSEMRATLARLGHKTTISYLARMCEEVLRHTGLLPHSNPGVMTARELELLGQCNPSLGLMLENASERLRQPGMPHEDCPDKEPGLRLKSIQEAGRLRIPFTTGILIGIGETVEERVMSLFAIKELHDRYGHIQEIIIQNFKTKPDIPMHRQAEPRTSDLLRTIAVARLVMPACNIQAPPNLTESSITALLAAGLNDWGGISPLTRDEINPECPWPAIAALEKITTEAGLGLRERLCIYPEYVVNEKFLRPALASRVWQLADKYGYAREN